MWQKREKGGDLMKEIGRKMYLQKELEPYSELSVMKFGGDAVRSCQQVAGIMKQAYENGIRNIAVVSAPRGMTENLLQLCDRIASLRPTQAYEYYCTIQQNYLELLNSIGDITASDNDIHRWGRESEEIMDAIYHEVSIGGDLVSNGDLMLPSRKDMILSYGERLGARITAIACKQEGTPVVVVDSTEIFETNRNFGNAEILPESKDKTRTRLNAVLQQGFVPIVTGFLGSVQGQPHMVTTLGRNTSDYSAAKVAEFMRASCLTFWKNTPGIFTDDPRMHQDVRVFEELNCKLAQSVPGIDKAIQSKVWEVKFEKGMEMYVKSFLNPELQGTRIVQEYPGYN